MTTETDLARVAEMLRSAALVVGTVGRNQYSRRLLTKNRESLWKQVEVLREAAAILEAVTDALPNLAKPAAEAQP